MEVSQAALDSSRHAIVRQCADELREGWPCRCLAASAPRPKLFRVVTSMLFAEYAEHMRVLLHVAFPGFKDLARPLILHPAVIAENGKVIAKCVKKSGRTEIMVVYENEDGLLSDLRRLSDELKLSDDDRRMLFRIAQKWIVLDKRINIHGERKVS